MRYNKINNTLFTQNRQKITKQLPPKSVAIINSNHIMPTNSDATMPFIQNSDLIYFSGINQEETTLVIQKITEQKTQTILFIKQPNPHTQLWEGHKLTKQQAQDISGITQIHWSQNIQQTIQKIIIQSEQIYLNSNEHTGNKSNIQTKDDIFAQWCQKKYPLHNYKRLAPLIHKLRTIKTNQEIELIKQACKITTKAFKRILKYIKPGITEYNIEAEFIHEFINNKSTRFAYPPIIASGKNTCTLHYTTNNKTCKPKELLLIDVGAEYAHYNADVTRTIPVSKRYTTRQKAVYNSVLKTMQQAITILRPGVTFQQYNQEIAQLIQAELLKLKLIDKTDIKNQNPKHPAYKKFFMHSISHHLGLDVHDVGQYQTIQPGMILTVEPGIYIPNENIGIRLEDDILITNNKNENLTSQIPIQTQEIEQIMNQ